LEEGDKNHRRELIELKKYLRLFAAGLIILFFVATLGFVFWASDAAPASEIALQAIKSDSNVYVSPENSWVIFFPAENPRPETGFIFYPGGKVDYRAYAPVLKMIADEGFFVVLVPVPLNLAFFDINAAAYVEMEYPEIKNWAVGGHSLGGVAAASYVSTHPDIKGLVLWASYPANDSLLTSGTKVISIYGTQDGEKEKLDESHDLLPVDTKFVVIEGGNHAQFGSYGPQAGDNEAAISPEEQWSQVATATVEFLKGLSK